MGELRAADRLLLPAVRAVVKALDLGRVDAAAARLAEELASAIDEAHDADKVNTLRDLAPKLLAVLVELGATPRARAVVVSEGGGAGGGPPSSPLARLRSAHRV